MKSSTQEPVFSANELKLIHSIETLSNTLDLQEKYLREATEEVNKKEIDLIDSRRRLAEREDNILDLREKLRTARESLKATLVPQPAIISSDESSIPVYENDDIGSRPDEITKKEK